MSDKPFILRSLCILDDPRVVQLPDALWRTYLELYLHACRVEFIAIGKQASIKGVFGTIASPGRKTQRKRRRCGRCRSGHSME